MNQCFFIDLFNSLFHYKFLLLGLHFIFTHLFICCIATSAYVCQASLYMCSCECPRCALECRVSSLLSLSDCFEIFFSLNLMVTDSATGQ